MRRLRSLLLALVLVASLAGCGISEQKEIEIGRESHAQFEREFGGLYPDPVVQSYVSNVGMEMARYASRPNLPWQFNVLTSGQVNAFAVPGGYVYITQGLLFQLDNEAMLAGVLGHEAAHIEHRHSVQQIQRAQTARGLSVVAGVVGAVFGVGGVGDLTGVVASLSLMKYGRDQEEQADLSGLRYMAQGGYNPRGMVQTMTVLQKAGGGGGGGPEFLKTHPSPQNRVGYLAGTIERKYAPYTQTGRLGEEEFRRNVLARRPYTRAEPVDASQPAAWCATCRKQAMARADQE